MCNIDEGGRHYGVALGERNSQYGVSPKQRMSNEVYIKWLEKRSLSQVGEKNTQYGISPLERMGKEGYIQWRKKQKVCRIGNKNPNAKSIIMYNDSGFYMEFEMLIDCARFLKDNNISNASELKCIQQNISTAIHKGSKYLGYNYKFKN